MTRKKNRLITFLWSLIPGAGEMYLGFMKRGACIMGAFWGLLALAGQLQLEIFLLLSPVIWFYSFFETGNLSALPDEEFYAMEDDFILHREDFRKAKNFITSHRTASAAVLIIFGVSILWNIFQGIFYRFLMPWLRLPGELLEFLRYLGRALPHTAVAILILWAGYQLLKGKKEELGL